METKYIKCKCGSEMITLEYDLVDDKLVYLSIWERGFCDNNKLNLFERIRWAWKILKIGKPFMDQIVLGEEEINKLVYALVNDTSVIFDMQLQKIKNFIDNDEYMEMYNKVEYAFNKLNTYEEEDS